MVPVGFMALLAVDYTIHRFRNAEAPKSTTEKSEKRCKSREIGFRCPPLAANPHGGGTNACQLDRSSTTANLTDLSGPVKLWL